MTENCLEIEEVIKFESSEACKGKKAAIGWLAGYVSGKKNVRPIGVMTKTSVLSDKKRTFLNVFLLLVSPNSQPFFGSFPN